MPDNFTNPTTTAKFNRIQTAISDALVDWEIVKDEHVTAETQAEADEITEKVRAGREQRRVNRKTLS